MGTVSMLRQNNIEELYFDCFKCAIKDVLRRIRHGRADHSMLIRFVGLSNRCIQKACVKFEDSSITTGDARCRQSCSAGIICSSSGIIRFDLDASTGCFRALYDWFRHCLLSFNRVLYIYQWQMSEFTFFIYENIAISWRWPAGILVFQPVLSLMS